MRSLKIGKLRCFGAAENPTFEIVWVYFCYFTIIPEAQSIYIRSQTLGIDLLQIFLFQP
jgi:hypothetical protein